MYLRTSNEIRNSICINYIAFYKILINKVLVGDSIILNELFETVIQKILETLLSVIES